MNYQYKLEELIKNQNGTILSSDLDKHDIPRIYLSMMVAEGSLERVDRGIYVSVDSIEDEMYAMQTKYPKLVYSHETALYIHNLTDRTPFEYSASVPSGYKVVANISDRFKIYYIKRALYEVGIVTIPSTFGNPIKVYNIERTICDIIRSKNRMDIQIFNEALKRFVRLNTVDYSVLMEYAKEMKVDGTLNLYMEVLL